MEREFLTISLYVDKDENLIGIPCGESKQFGIADIDTVLVLKAPYTDAQIENFIERVFEACFTKEHDDGNNVSTIEKYMKKKGFVAATADLTLISIVKTKDMYSVMPTFNDYEKGPLCIDDDERMVSGQYSQGELAKEIHDIIMVYMKANAFYKEIEEAERKKSNK
ncbi:MAG: hypothetical protein LIO43_00935 [Clostridiales bacterium]|nr:hypothetical protein [Clostridiales bacterium]